MSDHAGRFSNRVDDYIRYRPGYPKALITTLLEKTGLAAGAKVADIGSGTGIFTRLLLDAGFTVYAVEPNPEMRTAAEHSHADQTGFFSIAAPAEATGLKNKSLDLITAAQAFHWFNNPPTQLEFSRILKPEGYLALIWNRRRTEQAFQREYESILRRHAPEYSTANHMNLNDDEICSFFTRGKIEKLIFENFQEFDFDSLLGRVKSSSYCPAEDSEDFRQLSADLSVLFDDSNVDGKIKFEYHTDLYLGNAKQ